jgi:hypothetical protein
MQLTNKDIERLYLDYVNNWLSSTRWMEHHKLTKLDANYILKKGKQLTR